MELQGKNTSELLRGPHHNSGKKERKLALSDKILLSVEKPARYIGGEVNSVVKDPSSDGISSFILVSFASLT